MCGYQILQCEIGCSYKASHVTAKESFCKLTGSSAITAAAELSATAIWDKRLDSGGLWGSFSAVKIAAAVEHGCSTGALAHGDIVSTCSFSRGAC